MIKAVCVVCGKEYETFESPEGFRPWCSVGCQFGRFDDDNEIEEKREVMRGKPVKVIRKKDPFLTPCGFCGNLCKYNPLIAEDTSGPIFCSNECSEKYFRRNK